MSESDFNPTGLNTQRLNPMADLKHSGLIWCKGILFVLMGLLAGGLLIARMSDVISIVLLGVTVWAFCRAYYFAFYVIEHYVDANFRFAGLIDFLQYAVTRRSAGNAKNTIENQHQPDAPVDPASPQTLPPGNIN